MMWIGLTGGIATGKSAVQQVFENFGYKVLDADLLARRVVEPGTSGLDEVIQTFGENILSDGQLDRKKMAEQVFADSDKLSQLETILHPRIRQEAASQRQQWKESGVPVAFYSVPLLFEKGLEKQFDQTLLISCSPENQKQRLMRRDHLSQAEAELRIKSQWDLRDKEARADRVIHNNGSLEQLREEIEGFLQSVPSPG